jgi:hypothetical protein
MRHYSKWATLDWKTPFGRADLKLVKGTMYGAPDKQKYTAKLTGVVS